MTGKRVLPALAAGVAAASTYAFLSLHISPLLIVVPLALLGFLALLIRAPYYALLAFIVVKPVLDAFWGVSIGGVKLLYFMGIAVPLLSFALIAVLRVPLHRFRLFPLVLIWSIVSAYPLLFLSVHGNPLGGFETTIRLTNGVGFYFLIPFLADTRAKRNAFLNALLLSAIYPAVWGAVSLVFGKGAGFGYQATGGYLRLSGPYHDATAFIMELLPGFIVLLAKFARAQGRTRLLWALPLALGTAFVYESYTRMVWLAVGALVVLWSLIGRSLLLPGALTAFAALNWRALVRRFTVAGIDISEKYAFGGRKSIWKAMMELFVSRASLLEKLVGSYAAGLTSMGGAHNQYLYALVGFGLTGFVVLVALFVTALVTTAAATLRDREDTVAAVSFSVVLSVALLGFTGLPLIVPNVQWIFWGALGLTVERDFRRRAYAPAYPKPCVPTAG